MSALTDRLDEWAALAEKATPGPWTWGAVGYQEPEAYVVRDADNECLATLDYDGVSYRAAEFMAESRTAVPALVETLRAVLALPYLHDRWADKHLRDFESGHNSALGAVRDVIADALGVDL